MFWHPLGAALTAKWRDLMAWIGIECRMSVSTSSQRVWLDSQSWSTDCATRVPGRLPSGSAIR